MTDAPVPAWRSWLELMRLSNAPTVITNVLAGGAIGMIASGESTLPLQPILIASGSALLLYTAGMVVNDVMDAAFDAVHRPSKPIPSGRICPRRAAIYGGVLLFAGAVLPILISTHAAVIAICIGICIVAYNALHHRAPISLPLMGVCRALVYILGAGAVTTSIDWSALLPVAASMLVYITVVTIVARREVGPTASPLRRLSLALPLLAAAPALLAADAESFGLALFTAVVPSLWTALFIRYALSSPPRMMIAVPAWLAGICLIDGAILWTLGESLLAGIALGCFVLTVAAQRLILGT